jgi:lysine-N-methylase
MKDFIPGYYNRFRCIADRCPDSCCKEWAVDVDAETADYYRSLPGALGDRLREVLTDDNTMTITDGRCPMWRQDGLCRIHAEMGHDSLCQTCRDFPRIRHEFDEFTELGLELSCPEAARLILTTDWDMPSPETADDPDLQLLLDSRRNALSVLDAYPLPQALAIILVYGHHVQAALDGGEPEEFTPDAYLMAAEKLPKSADRESLFRFFGGLEILTVDWKRRLADGPTAAGWSPAMRAFARYLVLRYWLQAVSDLDLVCRVKLAIAACLLVGSMGGDAVSTAQLFSKEIENDPDNVEAILDGAYAAPALTDQNLLSLLLA